MKVLSKKLSYVLRHDPQSIGIILDGGGYCDVAELIEKLSFDGTEITFVLIDETVQNDKKNRFSFNADKTKIRANYGHSFLVDLKLNSVKPPNILYHGTAMQSVNGILSDGIKKRKRNHVHLSDDYLIAYETGKRHGKPIVFEINARKMMKDGYKFYRSGTVWLTEFVPTKYVKLTEYVENEESRKVNI